ncbi:hypothetical protein CGZ94_20235 [Enemella evansiae]|uniref:Uncharacterized protein n=1 Tax=Enemella evansiae TaxID=2016499 RepID=A0A255FYQ8_9ACTN|nr:hypothetical protein [Enemella evansiae]OYO08827.1 hypothetical protein CGZ94_20235 [Enemella evansiae]
MSNSLDVAQVVGDYLADPANDSPLARAQLLDLVTRQVYDHVKRTQFTGLGIDGRDGGERMSLAPLVDATVAHLDHITEQRLH